MSGLVSILLVVNNPNEKWLLRLLRSLNEQSYDNLELIVYDCCTENPVDENIFERQLNRIEYSIVRSEKDVSIDKGYEELTRMAKGKYLAYCEHEDIWEKSKIEILVNSIEAEDVVLVYSDVSIIDDIGEIRYNNMIEFNPKVKYIYGNNATKKMFFKSCVLGSTVLIENEIAKNAIPFSKTTNYGQWLAIVASLYGKISFENTQLVKYRMHENKVNFNDEINSTEEYYDEKIMSLKVRLEDLKNILINIKGIVDISDIEEFCNARENKNLFKIFKYRELCEDEALLEMVMKVMPKSGGEWLIKRMKR